MCRLAAYLGSPIQPSKLVFDGAHSLYKQSWSSKELLSGSAQADGYGVVWYGPHGPVRVAESRPIWHDPELRNTLASVESGCVVAALRNATAGLPIDRSGRQPMVHQRWTFALNGFVPDFRRSHMRALRQGLPDDLYGELTGVSDTETLFLLAVAALREGASLVEALQAAARPVHERIGRRAEAQLNLILADGDRVAVLRSATVLVTNSLYVARNPPFAAVGVVVASEPIDPGADWEVVDGHSFLEIDRDGGVRGESVTF